MRHADGSPLYFIAQIEDINDLKQTEWVNKRLMERITLANEAGGIGIWEWDLEPDIISWDKRMFELYEIPPHIKPTGSSGTKEYCRRIAPMRSRCCGIHWFLVCRLSLNSVSA